MKYIRIIVVTMFISIVFVPLLCLNTKPEVASYIDNRMLAENPFNPEVRNRENADLTKDIDNYISDRIGFRDEMLLLNTVLNDRLFGKMDHPSYTYGTDGYVFFDSMVPTQFNDYHVAFADMVEAVQNYCNDRNVPFLFVFNPEKKAVYKEFVPEGVNYNNDWVELFLQELDKRNINYVDNTPVLIEKKNEGEVVFNKKYNAGHWNDLGAFYGVNNILKNLQQFFPAVTPNTRDEFNVEYIRNTTLQASQFPIDEEEPIFTGKYGVENLTERYKDEIKLDEQYRAFLYTVNESQKQAGSPKTLVFQGSYMNGMGYKFLQNRLGEYIAVHDYQNILNFPYYFNLFQPECVIFEVAEYTFSSTYFDYERMKTINWNPEMKSYAERSSVEPVNKLTSEQISIDRGSMFTTLRWHADQKYDYAWFITDRAFDMKLVDGEHNLYEVTIPEKDFLKHKENMHILGGVDERLESFLLKNVLTDSGVKK